jgi:Uncharacterized conserved protein (DUF2190)
VAYEQPGFKFTLLAAGDLRTHQFKFVDVDATGRAALAGNGGRAVGVNQGKPNTGEAVEIMHSGISKVVAGAAVAAGDEIQSDATGRAVTATTTNQRIGVALQAAGAAGVLISVLLRTRGAA